MTRQLVEVAEEVLRGQGHTVLRSDLYGMRWKAVLDEHDFPHRADTSRLSFIAESGHAYTNGLQTADVTAEQYKLLTADALLLHFPLWWFGMPAMLKGWIDRVFAFGLAYGYRGAGNRYRYGEGGLSGKRALLCVAVGGPAADYGPRGINGPLEQLVFPITHGTLYFAGMDVLPTYAVYGSGALEGQSLADARQAWRSRAARLFEDAPIPFRPQNGGDYPDRHVLADPVAPGQSGLMAHVMSAAEQRARARHTEESS